MSELSNKKKCKVLVIKCCGIDLEKIKMWMVKSEMIYILYITKTDWLHVK